ncbi:hypothetical protein HNR32_000433 [Pectinatus brassicae]|uniref:Uncharacterized protein n=1 Tax=Pectinatus brassicae TaxID=862415 RepID=A0A840UQN5_9FIRM|nr:hypothetical protein [Pectinatus brassicae]
MLGYFPGIEVGEMGGQFNDALVRQLNYIG